MLSNSKPSFDLATCGWSPRANLDLVVHAVDAIIQTVEANPGLVIVTLAPLTNLALALAKRPDIVKKVSRCVVMGGAPGCEGSVTPAAEYIARIQGFKSKLGDFAIECNSHARKAYKVQTGEDGICLPDPVAP